MTDSQILEKLFNGGNYSLHYLIKLEHATAGVIRLINNNESYEINGEVYEASSFEYDPPATDGSGGALRVTSPSGSNKVFEFVENADENYKLVVVGVLIDNEVQILTNYVHFHGSVSVDEKGTIEFSLEDDDRLQMTFPPYVYDTDNNRGNA